MWAGAQLRRGPGGHEAAAGLARRARPVRRRRARQPPRYSLFALGSSCTLSYTVYAVLYPVVRAHTYSYEYLNVFSVYCGHASQLTWPQLTMPGHTRAHKCASKSHASERQPSSACPYPPSNAHSSRSPLSPQYLHKPRPCGSFLAGSFESILNTFCSLTFELIFQALVR